MSSSPSSDVPPSPMGLPHSLQLSPTPHTLQQSPQDIGTPVDQRIPRADDDPPPCPVRAAFKRRRISQRHIPRSHVLRRHRGESHKCQTPASAKYVATDAAFVPLARSTESFCNSSVLSPTRRDDLKTVPPPVSLALSDPSIDKSSSLFAPSTEEDSQPTVSQSLSQQRGDFPVISPGTLALLPDFVQEHQHQLDRLGRKHIPVTAIATAANASLSAAVSNGKPTGLNDSGDIHELGQVPVPVPARNRLRRSTSSEGLARASVCSAITAFAPMINPYLSQQTADTVQPPRRASSASCNDYGFKDDVNALNEPSAQCATPTFARTPALSLTSVLPFEPPQPFPSAQEHGYPLGPSTHPQQKRSLKMLLLSSYGRTKSCNFDMQDIVVRGAFSNVWRAVHRLDGCLYAIKKNLNPFQDDQTRLESLQEVFVLAALQTHPNILRYFDAWFENKGKVLHVQTELLAQGNLHSLFIDRTRAMSERQLAALAEDMAAVLEFMHARGIAHADIKPENIFCGDRGLERHSYILGDFGLACHRYDMPPRSTSGDYRYLCPEALHFSTSLEENAAEAMVMDGGDFGSKEKEERGAGPETEHVGGKREISRRRKRGGDSKARRDLCAGDMFSLGATLCELALGTRLENSGPHWKRLRAQTVQVSREVSEKAQSEFVATLVRNCMEPDVTLRATATEVRKMCEDRRWEDRRPSEIEGEIICTKVGDKGEVQAIAEAAREEGRVDEVVRLRRELADAQQRGQRFESVLAAILSKDDEARERYRVRLQQQRR